MDRVQRWARAWSAPGRRPSSIRCGGLSTNSGKSKSLDWAGYAVNGTNLQSVSGSWKQPAAKCPVNQVQQASFWVGIDGFAPSDPTVQQIGTDSDCTKVAGKTSGTPNYYAWYEMYPQSVVFLPKGSYPVVPGETIGAHVAHVGTKYTLTISVVHRWTFAISITAPTPPLNSSAEWIVEAPCSGSTSTCTILPLADFGTTTFSGVTVDGTSINTSGLPIHQITMTTAGGTIVKALPSPLNILGAAFSVIWKHI